MTIDELFGEFVEQFKRRKFIAGLLIAFVDFLRDLDSPNRNLKSYDDFLSVFTQQATTAQGKSANTLIVRREDGSTTSLRPFYNEAERLFRAEHKRFDYPSCAPHATQAWSDYIHWLDALVTFSAAEFEELRKQVVDYVLEQLKSHEFDPSTVRVEPPLFKLILENFDMTARKGEKTGAAFQGVVFGFIRADNSHLQVEIEKVRTGSKRLQRVGDVDAWEGNRLAITAEVKQMILPEAMLPDLEAFANAANVRGALGIIAALDFADGVRTGLEEMGMIPLSLDNMLNFVELWDPVKQRTAVSSLIFYVKHIEKNGPLGDRLDIFLDEIQTEWDKAFPTTKGQS